MAATPGPDRPPRVLLVRHAETAWSRTGRYTGSTDIPLTEHGRRSLTPLGEELAQRPLARVMTSPLQRARQTCEAIGVADRAELRPDLAEWRYGRFEGLTPDQIAAQRPGWDLWTDGAPEGESPEEVAERIDRVVAELHEARAHASGDLLLVAHGHALRSLAARWIGSPIAVARHLRLDPGALSVLGWHRGAAVIWRWNGA